MERYQNLSSNSKMGLWVFIAILLFSVVYAVGRYFNQKSALKDSSLVTAKVIERIPSRGYTILLVRFNFNGEIIEQQVGDHSESLKEGDSLILRVSNQYPHEYGQFVRALKSDTSVRVRSDTGSLP